MKNKKKMKKYIKIIITFTILVSTVSIACKQKKGTYVTTEQIILQSDSIILATVLGSKKDSGKVVFETDEIMSGEQTRQYFELDGYIVNKLLSNTGSIPYKKSRRKIGGPCNANDYERGSTYLLMLKNGVFWTAHKPVNEKITGNNDPWLMWVKGFIAGNKIK